MGEASFMSQPLYSRRKCQVSYHEGRRVGLISGLDAIENRKIPDPAEVQLAP
jgi:hypothetical protein